MARQPVAAAQPKQTITRVGGGGGAADGLTTRPKRPLLVPNQTLLLPFVFCSRQGHHGQATEMTKGNEGGERGKNGGKATQRKGSVLHRAASAGTSCNRFVLQTDGLYSACEHHQPLQATRSAPMVLPHPLGTPRLMQPHPSPFPFAPSYVPLPTLQNIMNVLRLACNNAHPLVLVVLVVLQVLVLERVSKQQENNNRGDNGLSRGICAIKIARRVRGGEEGRGHKTVSECSIAVPLQQGVICPLTEP